MLNNISISLLNAPFENVNHWKRVVSVKQNITLAELHQAIQRMLRFDDDHLFQYIVKGKSLDGTEYIESLLHCKWHYNRIMLKDVFASGVSSIFYNFDFGDNWVFEVTQTLNSPLRIKNGTYRVVDQVGNRLRQYQPLDKNY